MVKVTLKTDPNPQFRAGEIKGRAVGVVGGRLRVPAEPDPDSIEGLCLECATEIGKHQRSSDAVGDCGTGDIRPAAGSQRITELQLIGLRCDGWYVEDHVCAGFLDGRNLVGRRIERDRQLEHGADVVRPADLGRSIKTAIAALHQAG